VLSVTALLLYTQRVREGLSNKLDWLHEKYRVQADNDDVVEEITGYIVE
jgi:hypothetical protein